MYNEKDVQACVHVCMHTHACANVQQPTRTHTHTHTLKDLKLKPEQECTFHWPCVYIPLWVYSELIYTLGIKALVNLKQILMMMICLLWFVYIYYDFHDVDVHWYIWLLSRLALINYYHSSLFSVSAFPLPPIHPFPPVQRSCMPHFLF